MNEEKIKRLNEYKRLVKELDNITTRNATMLFFAFLVIVYSFNNDDMLDSVNFILGILGTGVSVVYLKRMIESITKKVSVENLIEMLEFDDEFTKKLK